MEENYQLQMLIETKSFDALTDEEVKMVLREITEEEYRSRRMVLENVKVFLQDGVKNAQPKNSIQRNVLAVMKAEEKENLWNKLFLFRVPAYAVAIIIVLFLIYPFLFNESRTSVKENSVAQNENSTPKTIYQIDTVFIEKEIPKIVEVEKVKYVTVYKDNTPSSYDLNTVNVLKEESQQTLNPAKIFSSSQLENQLSVVGKPTSTLSELNQFLVVGN